MFETKVYISRREQLRNKMSNGLVLLPGNNYSSMNYPANYYRFRQDSTFLYFFGLDHAGLYGVIDIDKNLDYIYGNDVDMDDIIWMGPQPTIKNRAEQVGITHTGDLSALKNIINEAIKKGRKIYILPQYRQDIMIELQQLSGIMYSKLNNYASTDLIKAIVDLRSVKDEFEIAEIDKACNIGYDMHTSAMRAAKAGLYERNIAGVMEGIAIGQGGMVSFPVIMTINGQTLHNHYHGNKLQDGKLLLMDAGAETPMHYASDFTRTIPVNGTFTQKQKEIYQIVLNANNAAYEMIKPGIKYLDVHLEACKVIAKGLSDLGLMYGQNIDDAVAKGAHALFMPHGLGHMMGLDVHDMEGYGENFVGYNEQVKRSSLFGTAFLRLGRELQKGFVLTNEPGIYFIPELIEQWKAEERFTEYINYAKVESYLDFGGIRLEDDILVTDTGKRYLGNKRIPITIDEVENEMKN